MVRCGHHGAMPRQLPIGLTPPDWLVRNLQPQQAPIPWAAVARAAIALALPLAIGLAAGKPAYGALASMGALSGVISDTADAYRLRVFNLAVPQVFGAVGVTIGSLAYGHGWVAVGAVTGVALVSGMISTIGPVASVSGLLLLLNEEFDCRIRDLFGWRSLGVTTGFSRAGRGCRCGWAAAACGAVCRARAVWCRDPYPTEAPRACR